MKLLVTGGLGFIGSNFVNLIQKETSYNLINVDKLTYAANIDNVKIIKPNNYQFIKADINDVEKFDKQSDVDWIVNFAAETHVDNSIQNSKAFIETNVQGVRSLLDFCRKHDLKFFQISTDEVYGSIEKGSFKEDDKLNPRNPYSASKAGAELLVQAYQETYGIIYKMTRCSNNYGPNQHEEKLLPKTILNFLKNKKTPVYGKGLQVRNWIHAEDHCRAVQLVLEKGKENNVYNIGGSDEFRNIDLVKLICSTLGKTETLIEFVKDRAGHDFRYSLDDSKIRKLGFKPKFTLKNYLSTIVP